MEIDQDVQPTRRRRHSAEFKEKAIRACMQPGMSIAAVALHYRLNANLLRRWVTAQEQREASAQAHTERIAPSAEFVPLRLDAAQTMASPQDIVIEIRRGMATVTVRWPRSAAVDCASWLHGWLL